MKKKQVEWKVGDRISFLISTIKRKGVVEDVGEYRLFVRCDEGKEWVFLYTTLKTYKVKRLVLKKKPVEKRVAREWWAREMDNTDGAVWWSPAHRPKPLGEKWFLVREVLDEQGEGK